MAALCHQVHGEVEAQRLSAGFEVRRGRVVNCVSVRGCASHCQRLCCQGVPVTHAVTEDLRGGMLDGGRAAAGEGSCTATKIDDRVLRASLVLDSHLAHTKIPNIV